MSNYKIDYSSLESQVYKKAYKLSDVKDQIEVLAFDIVRFKDGDKGADLWQVQDAEDGQYIVALYQDEEKKEASWGVRVNKMANALEISYKGDPLVSISSNKLGIPPGELHKAEGYLPEKLANSKKLVKALLNELNKSAKNEVLSKYPELF